MLSNSSISKNIIETCKLNSLSDLSCSYGLITLFIGFIICLIDIYAFAKMTKFYGKMNFENTVLLICAIQTSIILIGVITSNNILKCIFNYLQILTISLIIHKFNKISSDLLFKQKNTILIIIINSIYLIISIGVMIFVKDGKYLFYINLFYSILLLFISFILTYYCCIFLDLIKKYKRKCSALDYDNKKSFDINQKNDSNFINDTLGKNMIADGLFYSMKQKQLSLLYILNLLCTICEILTPIICRFFIKINYETTRFGILPKDTSGYIVHYSCFLLFFIHSMINYICFYWLIRDQYNLSSNKIDSNKVDNRMSLLDDKFIQEQTANIGEEDKDINKYLTNQKNSVKKPEKRKKSDENDFDKLDSQRKITKDGMMSYNRKISFPTSFDEPNSNVV